MRTRFFTLLALALCAPGARAGLYYSAEVVAELPARPNGFLTDQRALRAAGFDRADGLPSPLRGDYVAAADRLVKLSKTRALTADEAADLGALHLRLGAPDKALNVLAPSARKHPEHFRLAANLGTAFQYSGDLERAAAQLEEAVRLAPAKLKPFEQAHLKLVKLRSKERKGAPAALDDLFGVKYAGATGRAEAGTLAPAELKKLPPDALAIVQQLGLWLPADARLVWQFGELCNAFGDVRAAAACLDGCVTEFALGSPDLRARRLLYRAAADELAKKPGHEAHRTALKVKSSRPLLKAFNEALLPEVSADRTNPLPWPVLNATVIDAKARPRFAKYLDKLDGKTVSLTGFMQLSKDDTFTGTFLLLEYPVGCWFCETPDPTGLLFVQLKANGGDFRRGLVKVTGTLTLNRDNPESYLYSLSDARIGDAD